MKQLIIAEKPSVAAEIAKVLGGFKKYDGHYESSTVVISYAVGHLIKLSAKTAGGSIDRLPILPKPFDLEIIDRTKQQYFHLKNLMHRSDVTEIINACDAAREGELIFRLIIEKAECKKPVKRMWLDSMSDEGIRDAYKKRKTGQEYDSLGHSAFCRLKADWEVGVNLTIAVTTLYEKMLKKKQQFSVGRVITPTLAILVHRELEIANFRPENYSEVHGTFQAIAGAYIGKWVNPAAKQVATEENEPTPETSNEYRIHDASLAQKIKDRCDNQRITEVTEESIAKIEHPPELFDLTTLQRTANRLYKFSAQQTLTLAQSLYEKHKVITYPRTESPALPDDYIDIAHQTMQVLSQKSPHKEHAQRVLTNKWIKENKRIFNSAKVTDHFAIIPTKVTPTDLSAAELKLYTMIVLRFIAVFHDPAQWNTTTRKTWINQDQFKSTGRVLAQPGWLIVYDQPQSTDPDSSSLVAISKDEKIGNQKIEIKKLKTKPPKRYSEDTLLGAMKSPGKFVDEDDLKAVLKKNGLGTPATRAGIIERILADTDSKNVKIDPYAVRQKGSIIPTDLGIGLINFLEQQSLTTLTSPVMTGEWEQKLYDIYEHNADPQKFMDAIDSETTNMIDQIKTIYHSIKNEALGSPCPKCTNPSLELDSTKVICRKCDFSIPTVVSGKVLNALELEQLIGQGKTAPLKFTYSKKHPKYPGKQFTAALQLVDGKIEFVKEVRVPGQPISTPCPYCRGVMLVGSEVIECSGCNFKFYREVASVKLTETHIESILRDGKTPTINGFISTRKTPFSASLNLKDGKLEFAFEKPLAFSEPCPLCKSATVIDAKTVKCSTPPCTFKIWREIAKKQLSLAELSELLKNGRTNPISGFLKKDGVTHFDAVLKLEGSSVSFEDRKQGDQSNG